MFEHLYFLVNAEHDDVNADKAMTKLEILEMLAKELGYTLDHPAWH